MFCSKCGSPNEDSAEYCANCGAALSAVSEPSPEALTKAEAALVPEMPEPVVAGAPAEPSVENEVVVVPPAPEAVSSGGVEPQAPKAMPLPRPVPAASRSDPNTAFLIEFLAGIFGLLGIGYIYTGQTNDGVVRLVVWLVFNILAWVTVGLLSTILVGLICIPFQLVLQIGVPLWSANSLKKQLLAGA